LWNQAVHTDREVTANRPDIIIKIIIIIIIIIIFMIIIIFYLIHFSFLVLLCDLF
jgi:hypothetical protein